jgi:hypothetical protein
MMRRSALLAIVVVFVAIVATHLDAVPIWDGKSFWTCVTAVHHVFDPLDFRCYSHPTLVYLWLWHLTQHVRPWNPSALYVVNAVVVAASIVAFDALLRVLFPNRRDAEYILLTACYAFAPLFVAHAIFINFDYGATAFFVLFVSCLLTGRVWLASAFAIATLFTKEAGAAACAAAALAFGVAFRHNSRRASSNASLDSDDDGSGRIASFDRHSHNFSAASLHDIAADDGVFRPIGAFDEDVGLQRRDHGVWRVFVEHDDGVDARERFENLDTLHLRRDRTAFALVGSRRSVGIQADDQEVAERTRLLQVTQVSGMEQVEHAVREHDCFSSIARPRHEGHGLLERHAEPTQPISVVT